MARRSPSRQLTRGRLYPEPYLRLLSLIIPIIIILRVEDPPSSLRRHRSRITRHDGELSQRRVRQTIYHGLSKRERRPSRVAVDRLGGWLAGWLSGWADLLFPRGNCHENAETSRGCFRDQSDVGYMIAGNSSASPLVPPRGVAYLPACLPVCLPVVRDTFQVSAGDILLPQISPQIFVSLRIFV